MPLPLPLWGRHLRVPAPEDVWHDWDIQDGAQAGLLLPPPAQVAELVTPQRTRLTKHVRWQISQRVGWVVVVVPCLVKTASRRGMHPVLFDGIGVVLQSVRIACLIVCNRMQQLHLQVGCCPGARMLHRWLTGGTGRMPAIVYGITKHEEEVAVVVNVMCRGFGGYC